MKATIYGMPEEGPDGNLLMEFTTTERYWEESTQQNSYDPYACSVMQMPFMECLDIAGARTLGSETEYDVSADGTDNDAILDMSVDLDPSNTVLFGADVDCSGKTVGDGVANAYDLAVLMWYQFLSLIHI